MSAATLYWSGSVVLWLFFTGIGIPPVPEEAGILYAAGLTALHPEVPWWLAWPAASAGILSADMALYGIGRCWGQRVFRYRWVNRILPPERRQRIEQRLHGNGLKLLLMARLLPPLRTGVFLIAGTIRYSFVRFLLADAVYGLIGVGLVFFGGTALLAVVHHLGSWFVLLLALAAVGYVLYRYFRYLRKLELQATAQVLAASHPDDSIASSNGHGSETQQKEAAVATGPDGRPPAGKRRGDNGSCKE